MTESKIPELDVNFAWYHPFNLVEYDWLATDLDGFVANISTGGFGPIPQSVEDASIDFEDVDERLRQLPVSCEIDHRVGDPGHNSEFQFIAKRGIFVYNWGNSPDAYQLFCRPMKPKRAAELDDLVVQAWAAVITLPIRFSEVSEFTCCTRGRPCF